MPALRVLGDLAAEEAHTMTEGPVAGEGKVVITWFCAPPAIHVFEDACTACVCGDYERDPRPQIRRRVPREGGE